MRAQTRFTPENRLGRQLGLGRSPQGLSQEQIAALTTGSLMANFSSLAVVEYVTNTFTLPILDTDLAESFGSEINLLEADPAGSVSSDSSWPQNGLSQTDIFVVGIGAHVFAEPLSGAIQGNVISGVVPAAGAVPISPDAFNTYDLLPDPAIVTAGNPIGLAAGNTLTPAVGEWGSCAWQAMWHMVNAYQFEWTICNRFNVIQEMLADFCYWGSMADTLGAGTSQVGAQRIARRMNDRYQSLGFVGAFEPYNTQRIGVTTATAPNIAGSLTIAPTTPRSNFKTTNAYNDMSVTWGGLGVQNRSLMTPFRKMQKAILIEKGSPFSMKLTVQNQHHYNEMLRYLSISDNQRGGALNALIEFSAGSGGNTIVNPATVELSLDNPSTLVAFSTNTDRIFMKGGDLQTSVLVKGFEVCNSWRPVCAQMLQQGIAVSPTGTSWGSSLYTGSGGGY